MSGVRTSSRHHDQPSPARRHNRDDNYSRHVEGQLSRPSAHRHRSSSGRRSSRKYHDAALQESLRFRPEDYTLEDGVPPLRRQSTQPPHRRTPSTSHSLVTHRDVEANVYHRREVEPTSARRPTTPHTHRGSRHSTPIGPAPSTALVVVEEKQMSPRRSARASPRRSSRHDSRIETEDGVVRSPRQHISPTKMSPRRAHRQTGSPIRPERRAESSHHHAHHRATAEPHTRSPHSSPRHHRETQSARAAPAPEVTHRQDTLRYRSPPLVEDNKERGSPRQARYHSSAVDGESGKRRPASSHRHESAHRSHSDRPSLRPDSERRRRHQSRRDTASAASAKSEDDSRRTRNASRHGQVSQDSSVAPRDPAWPPTDTTKTSTPPAAGSTYVRPNGSGNLNAHRSSGSYIEVISVNSIRPGSSSSWLQPSPRRPREVGPPIVQPDPRGERIMQRINSTRHWIKNMKEEVEKDRERELQAKREAEAEEQAETIRQQEAERVRKERHSANEIDKSTCHRHRNSSRGSHRRTHSSHGESNGSAAGAPALAELAKAVNSHRHLRAASSPAASQEKPQRSRTRSAHAPSASASTAPSERAEEVAGSCRPPEPAAAPTPAPAPAAVAALHDTLNSSRKDGFDYPIFSFVSFLDGNTFDSTADLCQYNTQLAESLSDEHLDLLREVIFNRDEEAFAELLYGDDVQAEIDVIVNTLGRSEDPAVQREIVILQRAAVRRFNEKCSAALRTLLAAPGGLADAVQIAASQLERQAYETGVNSP